MSDNQDQISSRPYDTGMYIWSEKDTLLHDSLVTRVSLMPESLYKFFNNATFTSLFPCKPGAETVYHLSRATNLAVSIALTILEEEGGDFITESGQTIFETIIYNDLNNTPLQKALRAWVCINPTEEQRKGNTHLSFSLIEEYTNPITAFAVIIGGYSWMYLVDKQLYRDQVYKALGIRAERLLTSLPVHIKEKCSSIAYENKMEWMKNN